MSRVSRTNSASAIATASRLAVRRRKRLARRPLLLGALLVMATLGFAITLILVGIGIAAMLESVIAYFLSVANEWNMQEAMRWLAGSVNGASWSQIVPVLLALPVFDALLLSRSRDLETLCMGDDLADLIGRGRHAY